MKSWFRKALVGYEEKEINPLWIGMNIISVGLIIWLYSRLLTIPQTPTLFKVIVVLYLPVSFILLYYGENAKYEESFKTER